MKGSVLEVISGIFTLITIYLFVSRADQTVSIINSLFTNSVKGIEVLQGRD